MHILNDFIEKVLYVVACRPVCICPPCMCMSRHVVSTCNCNTARGPGVWGGSNAGPFRGFQICAADYPTISSLCLFDLGYRLKSIPDQTSFIDETTPAPACPLHKHNIVYSAGGGDTHPLSKKPWRFIVSTAVSPYEARGGIISDSAGEGRWLAAILLVLRSFYMQYLSYWFLLIKNLSSQLVTAKISTLFPPSFCEGCVSRGLIFQSLVIHLWQAPPRLLPGKKKKKKKKGREGKKNNKRSVFTGHIEKGDQPPCCWCFHLCVCQRGGGGVAGRRKKKDGALNNTANYAATFLPACRENRFEYLLFTQTSC